MLWTYHRSRILRTRESGDRIISCFNDTATYSALCPSKNPGGCATRASLILLHPTQPARFLTLFSQTTIASSVAWSPHFLRHISSIHHVFTDTNRVQRYVVALCFTLGCRFHSSPPLQPTSAVVPAAISSCAIAHLLVHQSAHDYSSMKPSCLLRKC
ncbi:hypothetical protein EJ08DRAFT_48389 [Tothia fuscella]|uniref:Uncharacterized protein n=1 Tax=Tothia fuscella TaxID=1048955 RepID=A0A9P4TSQ4_9PEZI|nr:hypothetical protein EJ08DRAFT_48389 [Tothia fuscella]